ncbi:MAG: DUF3794 domain-containing protein [Flavonifractor plautii]
MKSACPAAKPEAEELLKCRAALRCSESKVIGNKLIFKGESQLQMLYRSSAGGLCTAEYELRPLPDHGDLLGAGEESTRDVYVVLTGQTALLDSGDGTHHQRPPWGRWPKRWCGRSARSRC